MIALVRHRLPALLLTGWTIAWAIFWGPRMVELLAAPWRTPAAASAHAAPSHAGKVTIPDGEIVCPAGHHPCREWKTDEASEGPWKCCEATCMVQVHPSVGVHLQHVGGLLLASCEAPTEEIRQLREELAWAKDSSDTCWKHRWEERDAAKALREKAPPK